MRAVSNATATSCACGCEDGRVIEGSHALLAVGSIPNSEGIDLDVAGVEVDDRGYVRVNHNCLSNVEHIYAAGDVSGKLPLSSVAAMQGRKIAEHLMGLHNRPHRHLDYDKAASAVFTDPEIADVGLAEAEAFSEGRKIRVTKVPYSANAKALIKGDARGFVKILSDPATGVVLGGSIVGRNAAELISVLAVAVTNGLRVGDIVDSLLVHPSLAESLAGRGVMTDDFLLFAGSASKKLGAAIARVPRVPARRRRRRSGSPRGTSSSACSRTSAVATRSSSKAPRSRPTTTSWSCCSGSTR